MAAPQDGGLAEVDYLLPDMVYHHGHLGVLIHLLCVVCLNGQLDQFLTEFACLITDTLDLVENGGGLTRFSLIRMISQVSNPLGYKFVVILQMIHSPFHLGPLTHSIRLGSKHTTQQISEKLVTQIGAGAPGTNDSDIHVLESPFRKFVS